METTICVARLVASLVFLPALCAGLLLDLDVDPPVQSGSRAPCAILRCAEEDYAASTPTTTQDKLIIPLKNVSNLTIFKNTLVNPHDKNSDTQEVLVASLTSGQPRFTRVSNGVKVVGILDGGRASLNLEMFKLNDCLADFMCRLQSVDANGEDIVTTTRVKQGKPMSRAGTPSLEQSVSLQILELVHQLKAEMTVTKRFVKKLESKMETVENQVETLDRNLNSKVDKQTGQLESKAETLERNLHSTLGKIAGQLESKMETVENQIETSERNLHSQIDKTTGELESKIETLKDRLEDKLDSTERDLQNNLDFLENRIEDKLHDNIEQKLGEIHMKIITFTANAELYSDSFKTTMNESVTALGQNLKREQTATLTKLSSASQKILDNQSNANDVLFSMTRNLTNSQAVLQKLLLGKLAQAVGDMAESGVNTSKALTDDFALLKRELVDSFKDLASNVNHSALATLLSAECLFRNSNSTAAATIKDLLSPKRCFKGMNTVQSDSSYPYPLIQPNKDSVLDVPYLCDTVTDDGGWVIIQRHTAGDVDFNRGWEDYKNGFGDLRGDFWLGNENIHRITSSGSYELRVELVYQGKSAYARYGRFSVADETSNYALTVGGYSGTAGDSLAYHNGRQFTTLDRDNDDHDSVQCAEFRGGAWWYRSCAHSNLNGIWQASDHKAPYWHQLGGDKAVSYSEMKVRNIADS